jgi:plasmid stabilization system protein ParE
VGTSVRERSLPELREIVVGYYRVIYRLGNQLVDIIAVVHAARQLRDVD